MFKTWKKLTAILLVFLLISTAWAYLADVENNTAYCEEYKDHVVYYGSVTFSLTDSTNNLYTQALWIGDCDLQTTWGSVHIWYPAIAVAPATSRDVQVFFEGYTSLSGTKLDGTYFVSHTSTVDPNLDLDLASDAAGALHDTLGVNAGATDIALTAEWMRLKFDGQAGNPGALGGNTYYWALYIPKKVNGETWGKKTRGDRFQDTN